MKPAVKTALCSVPFVALGAFAQDTHQIQVNSGLWNPIFYLTAMGGTLYGKPVCYVTGHPENYSELNYYGVSNSNITEEPFSLTYDMPIISLQQGTSRQCVAAVQLLSNANPVSKWRAKAGDKLHPNMNFPVPFIAATMYGGQDSHGVKYTNSGTRSHVGMVFNYDSGGVWILDQNWGTGPTEYDNPNIGRLTMRYMTYSGNYQNNAENYYVVHQLDSVIF